MSFIRRCFEIWARGKILSRKFLVNGKKYPIFVSPDAQLKYAKGNIFGGFDRDLINIAQTFIREDSVVWDIGANVGTFTFASSVIAKRGKIVSVEPDSWLVELIRRTQKLKPYCDRDIKVISAAISDINGVAAFQIANRGRASNALEAAGGRSQMGGVREKQYVPTLTMDTVLESVSSPPDFVKIDVEGAEAMVVAGGSKVINEVRPVFYVEVGSTTVAVVKAVFEESNYKTYSSEETSNIFFVPEEKTSGFESGVDSLELMKKVRAHNDG